ncbi:MAG: ribosome maturation factor RimM [Firmicutes bacterium]|nr:ribosome maturation factor RimM [Bacillota bacterium]
MKTLEVGKIINTHGLRGEVKIVTWTDMPHDFEKLDYVFAKMRGKEEKLDIKNVKYQQNNIIVKFAQIDSIEQAEKYKNAVLSASREQLGELPEGVYYIADLIDCEVFDEHNSLIGILTDIFSTGSNDVYDIKRSGRNNLLVPIIDGVLTKVDTENKKIYINVPEGLEEE